MPKSKDAFRTISEVADWLDTPAHVLRFWESKFTQVKPVKRAGGRRYYRPADMLLLGGIKKLLHDDGLTIKGAQKLLREHGVKHVAALSQMLDEDLIEEAAYEADAQPEPIDVTPSTVLSFPGRTEAGLTPDAAPKPPSIEDTARENTEVREADAPAAADGPPDVKPPEVSPPEVTPPDIASPPLTAPQKETPAFGDSDTLPAFLRRAPAPQTITPHEPPAEPLAKPPPVPEQPSTSSADPTGAAEEIAPAKVAIDPVARFQPVARPEPVAPPEPASQQAPVAPVVQQPDEDTQPRATPSVDVPSLAKIAPTLASYSAPAGILATLPRARRIAPAIASEIAPHLTELRALRDRMRG